MALLQFDFQSKFLGFLSISFAFFSYSKHLACAAERKRKIIVRTDPRTPSKKFTPKGVSLWLENNPEAYCLHNQALTHLDRSTIDECIWYAVLKPNLVTVTRDLADEEYYHVELFSPQSPGLLLTTFKAPLTNPITDIQITPTKLGDGIAVFFANYYFIVNLPTKPTMFW